jgi:uncharacterized glyoxalase superfamily protein PhnB
MLFFLSAVRPEVGHPGIEPPPLNSVPFATVTQSPDMKKATPIIVVDHIEPCLPFWTDALGFELTASVPHEDAMGFAMLNKGEVQLMYQSRASVDDDLGEVGGPADLGGELSRSTTTLFVEVEDLDDVITAMGDRADVVVARRQTFYGMDEIFVRAPCGTLIGFAQQVAAEDTAE